MSKVSVIIPAWNEEAYLEKVLLAYRQQQNIAYEIIVVVNHSDDRTLEIAQRYADRVVEIPENIGVSPARNAGARIAKGDIFVFSDADSYLESGALKKIEQQIKGNIIGTPLGKPDSDQWQGKAFFFVKNWAHRLRIFRGTVDGVICCKKELFFACGGFNASKQPGELHDFIKRSIAQGATYTVFTDCYAVVSMRHYEKSGYVKTLFFWLFWNIFPKELKRKSAKKYYTASK